ncbi:MAG: type II secretion system protein [Chthoniobacter sp.]
MSRPPHSPRHAAFTLIEMITVIAIIAILAGLVLAINGVVQKKSATSRADAEIRALSSAVESYKNDNGGYPQDATLTDVLDASLDNVMPDTSKMAASSLYLYKCLSGDTNATGAISASKNYAPDFFKPSRLFGPKDSSGKLTSVQYIMDPFGNSYGYSTAGLAVEQQYRVALATNPSAPRPPQKGYNPTFDLFSTAGDASTPPNKAKWIKNW